MDTNFIRLNPTITNDLANIFLYYPNVNIFYLDPGTYNLSTQLNVNSNNIQIIGTSNNANDIQILCNSGNAINVTADNFVLKFVSINCPIGIALTCSNNNYATIQYCTFYGSDTNFTIYFSGPTVSSDQDLFDHYNNNDLSDRNSITNSIIYSKWNGDAVSFSLQKNGLISNNILRGCKLSIYMIRDTDVLFNYISDSQAHGIYCSLPSDTVNIQYNTVINSLVSSIASKLQLEHTGTSQIIGNINISNNFVRSSQYYSIEISDLINSQITNNVLSETAQVGIYLLRCTNFILSSNTLIEFDVGINIDINSINNTITANNIFSVYPDISHAGITLANNTSNNIVSTNYVSGTYLSAPIQDNGINNTITNDNTIHRYHTYNDETMIINLLME